MLLFILKFVYVIICLFLIIVVLLQSGKAADLAGAFGGMGSQTAFGPRGAATMLSKATTIAAALFMLLSIWVGIEQGRSGGGSAGSVLERTGVANEAPAPAAPIVPTTTPVTPADAGVGVDITPIPAEDGEAASEQ